VLFVRSSWDVRPSRYLWLTAISNFNYCIVARYHSNHQPRVTHPLLLHLFNFGVRRKQLKHTGFEAFTAVKMCIVTPCGLAGGYQRFGGTYRLCLQGRCKMEAINSSETFLTTCKTTRCHGVTVTLLSLVFCQIFSTSKNVTCKVCILFYVPVFHTMGRFRVFEPNVN
jgi:hypothetical protein